MLIETERLLLRPIRMADIEEFVALHDDPQVTRFIRPLDRRAAKQRLAAAEREWAERGHGLFALLEHASARLIGRTGLKFWPQFEETEIGWALRRDSWGQGYATEAARACLDWGFCSLPVPYLTAMIHPRNGGSIRLAQRLGFSQLRMDVLLGDPVRVYWLPRAEWAARVGEVSP